MEAETRHSAKTTAALVILTILIIIGVAASLLLLEKHKVNSSKPTAGQQTTASQTATVTYKGQDGLSVLALLNRHAVVVTTMNGNQTTVTSINSVKNADGKAWHVYVNGKRVTSDPAAYQTHDNDTILWKFE